MNDLISRQTAVDAMLQLQKEDDDLYGVHIPEGFDGQRAVEALMKLPSVERKKGKWIWDDEGYHCSECWFHAHGNTLDCMDGTYRFCPHCGAEMESE